MTDRMSAAEFLASQARKGKCSVCGLGSRPHKYGAKAVVDPETGTRIPSKHEARVLAMKRLEARKAGHIIAMHPMFHLEGGTYSADVVEIALIFSRKVGRVGDPPDTKNLKPASYLNMATGETWYHCAVRFYDSKGHLTAASRRSIKAVEERYNIRVHVIRAKSRRSR